MTHLERNKYQRFPLMIRFIDNIIIKIMLNIILT